MPRNNYLEIYGIGNEIAYAEAIGISIIFEAYAENCSGEFISAVGFNPNSGYVYIALDNGVQIASAFGNEAEYIITDLMNDEEAYFDNYEEALDAANMYYEDDADDFEEWMNDGNVEEIEPNVFATQDAQFRNRIKGMDALRKYYNKEFK